MNLRRSFIFLVTVSCLVAASFSMAQTLRFDPDPHFPVESQFSLPLFLEAGQLEVKGVECTITFDPTLVSLDSITPGSWYTGSGQDFFFWDYTAPYTYAIHFASAMLDGTNNTDGEIAICHFTLLDYGFCDLIFTDADVRDMNNDPLSFVLDNGLIVLDQAIDTNPVKFSALKAIYR